MKEKIEVNIITSEEQIIIINKHLEILDLVRDMPTNLQAFVMFMGVYYLERTQGIIIDKTYPLVKKAFDETFKEARKGFKK